ncbi:hypothetical protein [Paracoccus sediminilitoris]|uniref:hypothetical protein n=1 Tax=Paracoccus sediminilitoris TaxID=2202419 RepID=UPI00272BBBBA|nr:hypothetical protein [Paracoccus sediminilitoris]
MRHAAHLLAAPAVTACDDTGVTQSGRGDCHLHVATCKQEMACRELTTPTGIDVASATPQRDSSDIQMFVTQTGQNMGIWRTDSSHTVTELHHG